MTTKSIYFIRRSVQVALHNVPATRTLLQVLREDLNCVGTKEGCNEGDCGTCTVVLGTAIDGKIKYSAVNSCIRFAHSIDGMALWTVEDLTQADGSPHPAQQAMVECFGSQCGFCTPGFVMSLFATYQNRVCKGQVVTREMAQQDLSGNLCRCTGYRPILDAAQGMAALAPVRLDEKKLLQSLRRIKPPHSSTDVNSDYMIPTALAELLAARARHPQAQIVAGCTDVGLWVNKLHMNFEQVIDVSQVAELRRIEIYPNHIAMGASATLTDAFAALVADRPQLNTFALRFAGLPIRNSGTLGGNVANGSPIGDAMPLLIALRCNLVLMRLRRGKMSHREMALEDFYTGYRKNILAADEVLAWIKVPKPQISELLKVYKISKRFEDDISAVCLAINLQVEDGRVTSASIGAGGVAATPVRAVKTEAALVGQPWTQHTVRSAMASLRAEFSPISDMRASASYRTEVLGNLLQRYWLESQGEQNINLEHFDVASLADLHSLAGVENVARAGAVP